MSTLYNLYELYGAEIALGTAGLVILLLIWVIVLQVRLSRLHRRYRAAMSGIEVTDLESWLSEQRSAQGELKERVRTLETYSRQMADKLVHHAGRIGVVRFNPFSDTGSNQSFAIAWIDEEENGVVISSLYTREGVRLYAKPLTKGASAYNLSDEEVQAITAARKQG